MKNKDVISYLQKYDPEIEVCLFDFLKNMAEDKGEGSGAGIYPDFEVVAFNNEEDPDRHPDEPKPIPFIALGFKNPEYETDVEKSEPLVVVLPGREILLPGRDF